MPVNQITNPAAESTETAEGAIVTSVFVATGAITKGDAVQVVTPYTGTGSIKVKKATTTANFLVVGIAQSTVASGTIVGVVTAGPVRALFKTDSVEGDPVLQTGTNAGRVKTAATAVLAKTIGVCLATVTTTNTHLVWIYVQHA